MKEQRTDETEIPRILTQHPEMRAILEYVDTVVADRSPLLITGEVGVGKSLMAHYVHHLSALQGEMVTVDLTRLPREGVFDHLFGSPSTERGGDGRGDRLCAVHAAATGALLINEISEMDLEGQEALLRMMDQGITHPLPGRPPGGGVFLICTSSADLWALQRAGRFRKDLNLKIRAHHVHLPPLRERLEDVPMLVDHFLEKAAAAQGKKKPTPPRELLTLLDTYAFPGNVRELEEMVTDAVTYHQARVLSLERFKAHMDSWDGSWVSGAAGGASGISPFKGLDRLPTIREATRLLIEEAMKRAGGNQSIAARILGISQPALSKRLKGEE